MPFEFHHVMKNAANANYVDGSAVKQQVSRTVDDAVISPCTIATVPQMVAADMIAKFGAGNATDS